MLKRWKVMLCLLIYIPYIVQEVRKQKARKQVTLLDCGTKHTVCKLYVAKRISNKLSLSTIEFECALLCMNLDSCSYLTVHE